jgi:carbon-monoxide dehydrogenase large subunit
LPVPAAVANAIEDALRPLGARVTRMPLNPARISDLIEGDGGSHGLR